MRRRSHRYALAAVVTAGLLLELVSASATLAAAEDGRIGWGRPRDGLQVGLVPLNPKGAYRYEETLGFAVRVRNVSGQPVQYTITVPQAPGIALGPGNLLTVQTGSGLKIPFRLAAGEEATLPNSTYMVRLRGPRGVDGITLEDIRQQRQLARAATGATVFRSPTLWVQPGEYTLRCPSPIWVVDADDANRATAHRAQPGVLRFRVIGKALGRAPKPSTVNGAKVVWGQDVNGLQAGIAAGPSGQGDGDELPLVFYVRNLVDYPIDISFPDLIDADWHPRVVANGGREYIVRTTFLSRWILNKTVTLQPGQALPVGRTTMRLFSREPDAGDKSVLPTLVAPAGRYRVSLSDGVRYAGGSGFDMVLVTGDLDFTVRPR